MRRERVKLMEAKGFKTKKEVSDFLTELLGHTAHSHYFSDSQFCIPKKDPDYYAASVERLHRECRQLLLPGLLAGPEPQQGNLWERRGN